MVFGLGHHHQQEEAAYNSFYQGNEGQEFEGSKLHEGIAGAAAFYAMKKFEERRAAEGIQDHTFAREILATVAAAEAEKFAEKKGLSWEEKERAKRAATERAHSMYENYYMQ